MYTNNTSRQTEFVQRFVLKRINTEKALNINESQTEGKNENSLQFTGLHNEPCRLRNVSTPSTKDFTDIRSSKNKAKFLRNKILSVYIHAFFHSSQ